MKHLSPETLGALLDGALNDAQRADAERHLEACAECQRVLAALLVQDSQVLEALEHDPGETYFESFAGRVSARIGAEDRASAQPRRSAPKWWEALWTPRGLAFAGSAAALLVVGILALEQSQSRRNVMTSSELSGRAAQQQSSPTVAQEAPAPTATPQAPASGAVPQAADGGAVAPFAAAPSTELESKKRAPQATTFSVAPDQTARQARARDERGDAASALRKEGAVTPTAQRSVTPNDAGEERFRGSRQAQDVSSKDALTLQDAAPAPPPADKPADAVGSVRSELLRSLKGKRAGPLEPQAQGAGSTLSSKALAAPSAVAGGGTVMNETVAGFAWPEPSHALVARAESLSVIASHGEVAAAHDAAAAAWERVRNVQARSSVARVEAQARIAESRYAAWLLAPAPARVAAARDAISSVMALLPQGPRRQRFEAMLLRIREGADRR